MIAFQYSDFSFNSHLPRQRRLLSGTYYPCNHNVVIMFDHLIYINFKRYPQRGDGRKVWHKSPYTINMYIYVA